MGYSIRTQTHHYIAWYEWDAELGKRGNFVDHELYDNQSDPDENQNIAHNPEMNALTETLSKALAEGWEGARPK